MLTVENLKGVYPALATPFSPDGNSVDYASLEKLIDYQLTAGVQGLVACGSTGEAATLSDSEYEQVVSFCKNKARQKVPLIAGVGTNNTRKACELVKRLEQIGVDAALIVTPPYSKPSQDGIIAHFEAIKSSSALPLIAYNIPGRAVANILPTTVLKLAERSLVIGIKEACGNMDQILDLGQLVRNKISILAGDDSIFLQILLAGGRGIISASANVIPGAFIEMQKAFEQGNLGKAQELQFAALPMIRALFKETNPIPVKSALKLKGLFSTDTLRLPLLAARKETVHELTELIRQ